MIHAQAEILIARHLPAVWGFVVLDFFENYPRWSPEVQSLERLTPGPIAVGSSARQVRVDRGRRTDTTFRVAALEPQRYVEFRETAGRYSIRYVLAGSAAPPAAPGTRLRFEVGMKRPGLLMRPLEPVIRAALQEGVVQVVQSIRDLVEAEVG